MVVAVEEGCETVSNRLKLAQLDKVNLTYSMASS